MYIKILSHLNIFCISPVKQYYTKKNDSLFTYDGHSPVFQPEV